MQYWIKNLFLSFIVLLIINLNIFAASDLEFSSEIEFLNKKTNDLEQEVSKLMVDLQKVRDKNQTRTWGAIGTSYYFGFGTGSDPFKLIVLTPEIHRDLGVLIANQDMSAYDVEEYGELRGPMIPHVQLSGYVESQAELKSHYDSSINLNEAELDFSGWVNKWFTGYTNFGFDKTESAFSNFEIFLGFVILGNLDYSNWFSTIGQMYVPYGYYLTQMSNTGPIPKAIGRMKERAAKIGYFNQYDNGMVYASLAVYRGGRISNKLTHRDIDQFAISFKNRNKFNGFIPFEYDLTLSATNNLAEADYTRSSFLFGPFYKISHYVPGVDGAIKLTSGKVSFRTEYNVSLRSYDFNDVNVNNHSVKPWAFSYEANYNTKFHGMPITFNAIYTKGYDTEFIIPVKDQYGFSVTINPMLHTLVSAEIAQRKFFGSDTVLGGDILNPIKVLFLNTWFSGVRETIGSLTIDVYF